jgi:hypothetical protein
VSTWGEVFLGIIAVATLSTAIVQIGLLIAVGKLVRRIGQLTSQLDDQLKPIFGHLNNIARDAAQATSLARAQVERADRLFGDILARAEQAVSTVQRLVNGPVRDGAAILTAFRAAFSVIRDFRAGRRAKRAEEDDALFI